MPAEATSPDLVELTRLAFEAANRRDLDAVISFYASDAVFEGRMAGDNYEGRVAIRSFLEDWFGAYEELELKLEDVRDLGSGFVFAVVVQEGVLAGSAGRGRVGQREGWVFLWERGLIARHAALSTDIDEARAAAEALAESRG
jgi:ketosteroid isomerase-like protein